MKIDLTPVEMTLIAAAVNDRITWLDFEHARLEALAVAASLPVDLETNRLMRRHYAAVVRRLEQALDVPAADVDEARRRLLEDGTVVVGAAR